MNNPTNSQLADKIGKLEGVMVKGFNDVNKRIDPIHDFMNREIGKAQGLAEARKSSTLGVTREQWDIIKWLVLIIGGLVGVKLV